MKKIIFLVTIVLMSLITVAIVHYENSPLVKQVNYLKTISYPSYMTRSSSAGNDCGFASPCPADITYSFTSNMSPAISKIINNIESMGYTQTTVNTEPTSYNNPASGKDFEYVFTNDDNHECRTLELNTTLAVSDDPINRIVISCN